MNISLQFLGTGDAFGSGGRFNTCFYVKTTTVNFLIDCGATSLISMKKNNISTNEIDIIFITHLHGDHFGGIPFFLLDAIALSHRTRPLTIAGPGDFKEKIIKTLDLLYPAVYGKERNFVINFIELKAEIPSIIENIKVTSYTVLHSSDVFPHGLRIELEDKIIGFSGDTTWTENLIPIAKDADLFICECNFFHTKSTSHLDYQTLLKNKHKLNYKRMILTHFGDEMLEKLTEIDVDYAEDGKIIFLNQ